MNKVVETLNSLTPTNWIAIVGIGIAVLLWFATQYLTARRERIKAKLPPPIIKATINRKAYVDGWRSVQLHVVPIPGQLQFKYDSWVIERATLLGPKQTRMARAENDDYATGVFYPETPLQTLPGKAEGRPQRFALEFFIKFPGNDRGQRAKFKVVYSNEDKRRRYSTKALATVPMNAEPYSATGR